MITQHVFEYHEVCFRFIAVFVFTNDRSYCGGHHVILKTKQKTTQHVKESIAHNLAAEISYPHHYVHTHIPVESTAVQYRTQTFAQHLVTKHFVHIIIDTVVTG